MNARRDDDALSWDGDDDPTLDVGAAKREVASGEVGDVAPEESDSAHVVPLSDGFTAVGKGADRVISETEAAEAAEAARAEAARAGAERVDAAAAARSTPMGNAALIAVGVLGGVYLLYVIGWIVGGLRLQGKAQYLVADVMFQGSFWLAVLAPVLWFATVFLLTRTTRPWVRFAWLIGGAILLVPWPFVMIGGIGQ